MDWVSPAAQHTLQSAVFHVQPTPTIILSENSSIVLVNKAAQRLFQPSDTGSLLNTYISDLPIHWKKDDPDEDLQHLLIRAHNDEVDTSRASSAHWDYPEEGGILKLQVEISRDDTEGTVCACMLVSSFETANDRFRVLSFENLQRQHFTRMTLVNVGPLPSSGSRPTSPSSSEKATPYPGAVDSTVADQDNFKPRFAQLCDAIYDSEERHSFFMATDNTFALCSYRGDRNIQPVEVDDLNMFLDNFDVWDEHFQTQLPFSEYPVVRLNRDRKHFRMRLGLKKDGRDMVVDIAGDPICNRQTGEYIGGVAWVTPLGNYNDMKTAEFKHICDCLPHMLWTIDASGHADYFSQSWYDFTGLTEEQSMGLAYTNVIDKEDLDQLWSHFHRAKHERSGVHTEAKYKRKDGQWVWMHVRSKPVMDSNNNVLKWYGTCTEVHEMVTERREAETKKLQMMEMLSMNEIGLFEVADRNLRVLEGRMHWLSDERRTRVWKELDDRKGPGIEELKRQIGALQKGKGESSIFEGLIRSRWYKFRLLRDGVEEPEGPEKPKKVLGCSVDVTSLHERAAIQAENHRLTLEASLEIEKNRLKTAFLAHMSHEIRTPIAGIIGTADMLAESNLDAEQRDCVSNIQVSGNNLLTIVNDILDLSKIEAGQLKFEKTKWNLCDLVNQVRDLFKRIARNKSLELTCDCQSSEIEMVGDPGRVKQILTNLVSNAIKFTSQGSIELSTTEEGAKVKIAVQDSGEGIDDDTIAMLFKPFVQGDASTARRHGGTGLGLAISRNLAEKMGGDVALESSPGKGTRAILTLPKEMGSAGLPVQSSDQPQPQTQKPTSAGLALPGATAAASKPITNTATRSDTKEPIHSSPVLTTPLAPTTPLPRSQPAAASSQQLDADKPPLILIVEDNNINQKVTVDLVRKLGYRTHAVWNGQEALDYLTSSSSASSLKPLPAAILMDCQMPLLDGYEATKRLRMDEKYKVASRVPVIALTASAIQGDQEKCQASGMDDYLSKPVNKILLKAILEKWVLFA
ncbi:hypothetical protein LTR05_008602 [Lithohypha guttulata]|uniref:Histidine kinase n=1 Tax=Lithohypha guttulata TaxID=1690604 RepID=A0AAN7QPL0_9EURO|nr:hypothetical protein LTR05_008602 [Lithohypha guttulata]